MSRKRLWVIPGGGRSVKVLGGAVSVAMALMGSQAMAQPAPGAPPSPEQAAPPSPDQAMPTDAEVAPPSPTEAAPPTGAPPSGAPYGQPAPAQPYGQPAPAQPYGQPAPAQPYGQPPPGYPPASGAPGYGAAPNGGYRAAGEPYTFQPPPGAQRHDGFYLRFFIGPAFTSMRASDGVNDVDISGGGAALGFAVGGAVSDNLIIYGELAVDSAASPDVQINDVTMETGEDVSASVGGIGAGLAYYFTPANIYLSGTLSAMELSASNGDDDIADSGVGFGIVAMVGKEWWVSDGWGLGVAGQLLLGQVPNSDDDSDDITWDTTGLGLVFSATYN